jgi:alpha-glucoside transport system permease protein
MARASTRTAGRKSRTSAILINGTLLLICIIWTIPTFGLLVSSFRNREQIRTTGWWTVFPHRTWTSVEQVQLERGSPLDQSLQVAGATVTDEQRRGRGDHVPI